MVRCGRERGTCAAFIGQICQGSRVKPHRGGVGVLYYSPSPNRFTCEGPRDFTFVSGLAFLPHCGCCGRMILHLSPICLPLVSHCLQSLVGELAA